MLGAQQLLGAVRNIKRPLKRLRVVRALRHRMHVAGLRFQMLDGYAIDSNLRLLHDTLANTPFHDRYFVTGGLLLGWAREGRVLRHDRKDVDFGFFEEHVDTFCEATPAMENAGFRLARSQANNAGHVTEYTFLRDAIQFDFFEMTREGGLCRYYEYGKGWEMIKAPAFNGLADFEFLGRRWKKPSDHAAHLASMYGDWQTPVTEWDYTVDDQSIIEKYPWHGTEGRLFNANQG